MAGQQNFTKVNDPISRPVPTDINRLIVQAEADYDVKVLWAVERNDHFTKIPSSAA